MAIVDFKPVPQMSCGWQDLANLTWGFARLEVSDEELFDSLAAQACTVLRKKDTSSGFSKASPSLSFNLARSHLDGVSLLCVSSGQRVTMQHEASA